MYTINKIVGHLVSPAGFGMALVVAAILARTLGRRRLAEWAVLLTFANFWVWSTPLMTKWLGATLEAEFLVDGRVPPVESLPQADLIELHGGGMGLATNIGYKAEMWSNADRVWYAARIWKAGKAPKILVTAPATDLTTGGLLADFGVPEEAIVYDFRPRNTEEEAKCVSANGVKSVLVVTSAWHMKRTMLMYQKYVPNVKAIPAPCDFEFTLGTRDIGWLTSILPSFAFFPANSTAFHEWLGYWGYGLFR